MKDIFILQGKSYISAKRASTISDYTSDYIGQLCRSKKLDCVRVGHAWFVCEESLFSHKAKVAQDLEVERTRYTQVASNQITNNNDLEKYREHGTFLPQLKKEIPAPPVPSSYFNALNATALTAIQNNSNVGVAAVPVLKSFAMTMGMMALILGFFVSSLFVFTDSPRIVAVGSSSAGVYDAIQFISVFFQKQYLAARAMFKRDTHLALNSDSRSLKNIASPHAQGIAVVASSGNADADASLKAQIQETFSDQVEIRPDASGTGGVITPVFKKTKGSDFVYVLVPVKDKASP